MLKRISLLTVILIGWLIYCSPDMSLNVEKTQSRLQVLSVISPAFDCAEVYVGIAYPESAPIDISGAVVILSDSTQQILCTEIQPGLYQDKSNSIVIQPEDEYYLNVTTSDGKTYSDSTIVPAIPEIINFNEGDTAHIYYSRSEREIPTIKFKQDDSTFGYILSTIIEKNGKRSYITVKTDSLETALPFPTSGINWFSDTLFYNSAKLQIWALDSAASYIDNQDIWGEDRIKWNLFGSMSMREIEIIIEFKFERDNE